MARPSRKPSVNGSEQQPAVSSVNFNTAIYARLSSEDKEYDGSLENQILMIEKHIGQTADLTLCATFSDNGLTGTNFQRPGFENLMDEIRRGRINCIVVKDLSRFGRDYLEAGNFLETIFPRLGIRFISIGDNYDSFDPRCKGEYVTIALKNMINAYYAKDISEKIRAAYKVKRQNGEFTGKVPPYGYLKSPENKNKLIVDAEAAEIVRMIFRLNLDGMGSYNIARHLSGLNIPTPGHYRYIKGIHKEERYKTLQGWDITTVKDILERIEYVGHLAMGKTTIIGGKQKELPREDWVIAENTHEPIISQGDYDAISEQLRQSNERHHNRGKYVNREELPENILEGLIFCADCGRAYRRVSNTQRDKKTLRLTFICVYCNQHSPKYTYRHFRQDDLYECIYTLIRNEIDRCADLRATLVRINASESEQNRKSGLDAEIQKSKTRLDSIAARKLRLYNDCADGVISEGDYKLFRKKYDDEEAALTLTLERLTGEKDKLHPSVYEGNNRVALIKRFADEKVLTREMALALIEKITVTGDCQIEIFYRFGDEYEKLENLIKESEVA